MATRAVFDDLEEGDRVVFNDRKQPLTVTDVGEEKALVEGPQGGAYMLFLAEDDPDIVLVSKPGNRRYASYVTGLRVTGAWEQVGEDAWTHTGTGAKVWLETNPSGHWTVRVEGIDGVDVPRYGFTAKKFAREEAERIRRANPEG